MKTLDQLLQDLCVNNTPSINELIQPRDSRLLKNLVYSINTSFITEKQANLLVKVLNENLNSLEKIVPNLSDYLDKPTWSKSFRVLDEYKKVYIEKDENNEPYIIISFSYSSIYRGLLSKLHVISKDVSNKDCYKTYLTEKMVVSIVDTLSPHGFNISNEMMEYYNQIKSWNETVVKEQFSITKYSNDKFRELITADIGSTTPLDSLIIKDREIRYQYITTNSSSQNSLDEILANRNKPTIWIDSTKFTMCELLQSLQNLKRFPVLFSLDSSGPNNRIVNDLISISSSLDTVGITDKIGVYCRLNNNDNGKKFNQLIAEKSYNSVLDKQTMVAAIDYTKLPKFFLKTDWEPMSVISMHHQLGFNKTAVYANKCDLIIVYSDKEPLIAW